MMAFFGVIGCCVSGRGFEDIFFQAGLCSSGSIAGLLSGKHYNRNMLNLQKNGKSSRQNHIFSNKRDCMMINEDQAILIPSLSCNHEEADTKLVALVCAANVPQGDSVMVRSPSADIDILTLFVSHNFVDITIYIDNGIGKNRKIINVTSSELSAREKIALIHTCPILSNLLYSYEWSRFVT